MDSTAASSHVFGIDGRNLVADPGDWARAGSQTATSIKALSTKPAWSTCALQPVVRHTEPSAYGVSQFHCSETVADRDLGSERRGYSS